MLAISLFCAAVGLALGARFRIFVLVPAMVLALVTIISYGVAARLGFREAATTLVISLVALQLGWIERHQNLLIELGKQRLVEPSRLTSVAI